MARFDSNRNRGYDYGHATPEPGYGGAVYGYSSASSQSSSSEHVQYGSYPGQFGPPKMELFKSIHGGGENPLLTFGRPWTSGHDRPKTKRGSPRKSVHRDSSPPRDHRYGSRYNSDDESDDGGGDDNCFNGVCYPKPKDGGNDRHGNQIQPKRDPYPQGPYHETSYPGDDPYNATSYPTYTKPKGKSYNPRGSYTVPVGAQPQQGPYYETPNARPSVYNPPPPVRTNSPDHTTRRVDHISDGARNSPRSPLAPSPRKDHHGPQETIDSAEARRRYGGAAVGAGAPAQPYKGTIDAREAARRYNGVLV